MTDIEKRLTAALTAGAADAPPAGGLADGTRRRLRARRRTRGVVGAVLAVLLVAVPVGVVARDGGREVAGPVEPAGWRTETWRGLEVDVPAGWGAPAVCGKLPDCATGGPGVAFFDSGFFDATVEPGLVVGEGDVWEGFVTRRIDGRSPAVWVTAADRDTAQRVVDSVRLADPPVDDGWTTVTWRDLVLEVPAGWEDGDACGNTGAPVVARGAAVMCPGFAGYGVRLGEYPPLATLAVTDEMQPAGGGPGLPDGSWWANIHPVGSPNVALLVTPDRETGQRILDSARRTDWTSDGWRTETWSGLSVDVPGDWVPGAPAAYCIGGRSPERGVVQRPSTGVRSIRCNDPHYGFGMVLGSSAAYDTVYPSGHVWQYTGGQEYVDGSWLGHWYDGERLVRVNAGDRATVERILASVAVQSDRQ